MTATARGSSPAAVHNDRCTAAPVLGRVQNPSGIRVLYFKVFSQGSWGAPLSKILGKKQRPTPGDRRSEHALGQSPSEFVNDGKQDFNDVTSLRPPFLR